MEFKSELIKDRLEIDLYDDNGKKVGYILGAFNKKDVLTIEHTVVDQLNRGKGYAAMLVKEALKYVKDNRYKVNATCSYAYKYFQRNSEEVKDLLAE